MNQPDIEIRPEESPKYPWWPEAQSECELRSREWSIPRERPGEIIFYDLRHFAHPVAVLKPIEDEELRQIFRELVSEWKKETWFISSIKKRISHPSFLKIVGLGSPAVPLIIEELRRQPDYWSFALEAITREDPVPRAESLKELRDGWLVWAAANGY
jgi:hypothetical protein